MSRIARLFLLSAALSACSGNAPAGEPDSPAATPAASAPAAAPDAVDPLEAAARAGKPGATDALRLRAILLAAPVRDWAQARAMFPGIKWEPLQKSALGPYAPPDSPTHNQWASVGEDFYNISGTASRVSAIDWSNADGQQWEAARAALKAAGVKVEPVGCIGNFDDGYFRLSAEGKTLVVHYTYDFGGSAAPASIDSYMVDFDKPFGEHTQDEIARGRVGYCE